MTTGPSLDQLLLRAREVQVRPDVIAREVAEIARLARVESRPARRWPPFVLGAGASAAIAALVVWLVWPRPPGAIDPVRVGDRVAIVAQPGTAYRVAHTGEERTEIEIDSGVVTARLWPGERGHELVLRGSGLEVIAAGTVYTVGVDHRGAWVHVQEGAVRMGDRRVGEGEAWPENRAPAATERASASLLAMSAPATPAASVRVRAVDGGVAEAPPPTPSPEPDAAPHGPRRGGRSDPDLVDAVDAAPALVDRWRRARLLRAQGEPRRGLDECLAIADAGDPTWSPIALVEAIRIALDALAAPERSVEIADRMIQDWPAHTLIGETRALRCRALRQLGRSAECDSPLPE